MTDELGRVRKNQQAAIDTAVLAVVRKLERYGVTGVHWFWPEQGAPAMWLVTTTDAEKSMVVDHGMFATEVHAELSAAGVPFGVSNRATVTVESLETLDRDYHGSWAYLLR